MTSLHGVPSVVVLLFEICRCRRQCFCCCCYCRLLLLLLLVIVVIVVVVVINYCCHRRCCFCRHCCCLRVAVIDYCYCCYCWYCCCCCCCYCYYCCYCRLLLLLFPVCVCSLLDIPQQRMPITFTTTFAMVDVCYYRCRRQTKNIFQSTIQSIIK